jgi:hypothetical protein
VWSGKCGFVVRRIRGTTRGVFRAATSGLLGPSAPASIHAFKSAISVFVGGGVFFGGIFGFALPSRTRTSRLSELFPGTTTGPLFPPAWSPWKLSRTKRPSASSELWQPLQYLARIGATIPEKSGSAPNDEAESRRKRPLRKPGSQEERKKDRRGQLSFPGFMASLEISSR